jgi:hypothetical protein
MGTCMYCGDSAGWFKGTHDACFQAHTAAKTAIVDAIGEWLPAHPDTTDFEPLLQKLTRLAQSGYVDEETVLAASRDGIHAALEKYLDDNMLSKLEEEHLFAAAEALGLDGEFLAKHPRTRRLFGAAVLRRVLEGEAWDRPWNATELGLILGAGEELLWVEQGLTLREPKTSRSFVGASAGVSVRVARGVYFRVGQFKGHPIDRTEVVEVAKGTLALTNRQLYFVSREKGFKLPYAKLVSVIPFEDGIGLQRDGVSPKPQFLHGGDGWLLYNMVMNFAQRASNSYPENT